MLTRDRREVETQGAYAVAQRVERAAEVTVARLATVREDLGLQGLLIAVVLIIVLLLVRSAGG